MTPQEKEHAEALISSYIDGDASPELVAELDALIKSDPQVAKLLAEATRQDHNLHSIYSEYSVSKVKPSWRATAVAKPSPWTFARVASLAAAIAIGVGVGIYFFSNRQGQTGAAKSVETLALVSAKGALEHENGAAWETVPASLTAQQPFAWTVGSALRATQTVGDFKLADGSTITLNAGTQMRLVALAPTTLELVKDGDVFCSITHPTGATGVRFIVRTPDADVNVTGTEFGVKRAAGKTEVAVVQGRVECANAQGKEHVSAGEAVAASKDSAPTAAVKADVEKLFAWRSPRVAKPAAAVTAGAWTDLNAAGLPEDLTRDGIIMLRSNSAGRLYAALGQNGVYQSDDGARTWTNTGSGIDGLNIRTLLAGARGEVVCGEWKKPDENVPNNPVYCYTLFPGAKEWKRADMTWAFQRVVALCDDSKGRPLAASLYSIGVLRSEDNGRSFKILAKNLGEYSSLASLLRNPTDGTIIAGTARGFFSSTDDGETWTLLPSMKDMPNETPTAIGFTRGGDELLSSYNEITLELKVYKHRRNSGQPAVEAKKGLPQSGIVREIVTASNGNLYLLIPKEGVYVSTDNGDSWQPCNEQLNTKSVTSLHLAAGDTLYAGTRSGEIFARLVAR